MRLRNKLLTTALATRDVCPHGSRPARQVRRVDDNELRRAARQATSG